MGLEYIPTHATFLMVKINISSSEVFKALLKKGVIIRFHRYIWNGCWIRVTTRYLRKENEIFVKALKEVINDLQS